MWALNNLMTIKEYEDRDADSFDNKENKGADEKFCGEVRMWLFEPDGTFDDHIVVITCMSNGFLKNENHAVGLIATDNDIENKVEEL